MTEEEILEDPGCLTLPPDMVSETDFKAEEAIKVDESIKLPSSFSLGKWVYKTNYQWSTGSCTSNSTSHWVQVLSVKKNWVEPTDKNIITPSWKDLWRKMWHNPDKYEWGDYLENAVSTALKEWIVSEEDWKVIKFDGYATQEWTRDDKGIEKIKRFLYQWCPVIWILKWLSSTWTELRKWELKTIPSYYTWWHAICCVWWDEWGLWFLNSWSANDWKGLKSRFYISNDILKKLWDKINFRYWVLYNKENEKKDSEYLKRKNAALVILQYLKKAYDGEPQEVKEAIVILSKALRGNYPELNGELPIK